MQLRNFACSAVMGGALFLAAGLCAQEAPASTSNPAMAKNRASGVMLASPVRKPNPLFEYKFTNELGRAVSLSDFEGQTLAITFFFTRCPNPDFCPRLSKNFQEASVKLAASHGSSTNWHFLSFSFDPAYDTPDILKAYAERYQYDPSHWSFLTGPKDKITALLHESGVQAEAENGLINHNFRTLIIDPKGKLRMIFPMGGDLSEAIVSEMQKAGTDGVLATVRAAGLKQLNKTKAVQGLL